MDKKKRILFVSLFGDYIGGGQRSLFLLLKGINRDKYMPYLVSPSEGAFVEDVRALGITVFIFEFPSFRSFNIKNLLNTVARLKKLVTMCSPDIIHTESGRSIVYLKFAVKRPKVPIVWHVRVSNREPLLYDLLLYHCADQLIAVSHAVKKRFARFSKSDKKIQVIHNAVDVDSISVFSKSDAFRNEIGTENTYLVGIVGQVMPLKGHETFLSAAAIVAEKIPDARFLVVGDGDELFEEKLKRFVSDHDLDNRVSFLGYRDDSALIIGALDILVNASRKGREWEEGFSRVIIEAMALGKAVIATNVGGNSEAIEDQVSGILIDQSREDVLSEAIITLLNDEEKRIRLGRAAKERAEKYFSLAEQIKKIEQIYGAIRT